MLPLNYPTKVSAIPLISAWRGQNSFLDAVFYDVGALTRRERHKLSAFENPEGSVLVVPPSRTRDDIQRYDLRKFLATARKPPADAIAVAGVGSSALGTAALARNIADHLHRPVAGVVSGYGLADLAAEALGGWFVLGMRNAARDGMAKVLDTVGLDDDFGAALSTLPWGDQDGLAESFVGGSPDSTALLLILAAMGQSVRLLVGHSKGNYSIENALEGLVQLSKRRKIPLPKQLCVVTLGAVIRFPEEFTDVHQLIGSIDAFGMMNSRPGLKPTEVPGAWHSLNSRLPGHLSVAAALREAGV